MGRNFFGTFFKNSVAASLNCSYTAARSPVSIPNTMKRLGGGEDERRVGGEGGGRRSRGEGGVKGRREGWGVEGVGRGGE